MGSISPTTHGVASPKKVIFFDIDNCLYSKSAKVHNHMADLIHAYFEKHLGLAPEEAVRLHREYYTTYGLAVSGLARHHHVNPLEFNAEVDDKVPLDELIKPSTNLRQLLQDIDRSRVKVWLFTNAYVTHARRVVRILGVDDMFDGLTFCDYSSAPFLCKPQEDMYTKAMREAGVENVDNCYLVDDSYINCAQAQQLGWNTAHLVEDEVPPLGKKACKLQIKHLEELRLTFSQLFMTVQT